MQTVNQINIAETATQVSFSTHLGFAEYHGKSCLYDGNFDPCCKGSRAKVIAYLESLIPAINPNPDEGLKWDGVNGTWYSGAEAWLAVEKEIVKLMED